MEMVVVVHPTLEDYSSQVHAIAEKYGLDSWLDLYEHPEKMNEEDRDDFSFIAMAVGDQLIHREFNSPLSALAPVVEAQMNFVGGTLKKAWNALRRVGA